MMNSDSVACPAVRLPWRHGRLWLALTVCALGHSVAYADNDAAPSARATTSEGQAVLEDQVLQAQRAAVARVGQFAAPVQPGLTPHFDALGSANNSGVNADSPPSDGLARVLGSATTAPGAPTFDYSALARAVGDQTRYGDPLDDAEPDARASDQRDTDARHDLHGTISVSVGTGGMRHTRASVTLPVIDDELTVRITGEKGRNTLDRYDSSSINDSPFLLDRRYGGRGRNDYWYRNEDSSSLGLDERWTPNGATRDVRRHSSKSAADGDH